MTSKLELSYSRHLAVSPRFSLLHIYSVALSNFSNAYSMQYAPYLVFGLQIRRKEMKKGQVGYGIALRRFCGLRVNVLQPLGARRFNILSSRTVILMVPVIIFRGVGGYGLITRIKSGKCCVDQDRSCHLILVRCALPEVDSCTIS
jgi:hypothetical protein